MKEIKMGRICSMHDGKEQIGAQNTALKWIMNSNEFPQYSVHHKEIVKLLLARTLKQLRLACGIYGGQSDIGTGFLRVLRLSLPILNIKTAPHSRL
jgi:hypothetical protein